MTDRLVCDNVILDLARRPDVRKLLITDIDHVLGGNLALALADRFDVVGLTRRDDLEIDYCRTRRCDPSDPTEVGDVFDEEAPAWVIHCGPLSRSSWNVFPGEPVEQDREVAMASRLLASATADGKRLAVLLSDAMFTGPRMFHTESSPAVAPGPVADTARAVEKLLADSEALVVRTHAFGWSPDPTRPGFAEIVWRGLTSGRGTVVDADRFATPILATDLAEVLHKAYRSELSGLFHIAGAERANQHRFAAEMAVAFELTGRQVLLESPAQVVYRRCRADETSLNTRALRTALKMALPMLREGMSRFALQAENGHRGRLCGEAAAHEQAA